MRVYNKETLELAFYKYVELVDFEDYVYCGWFVPNIKNPKEYFILNKNRGNILVFHRSHIKSITYANNGYTLHKTEVKKND